MSLDLFADINSIKRGKELPAITNYIYFHHLNEFIILPVYPETITDSTQTSYQQSPILSRSAPIYSYSSSGPRSIMFAFDLHREMLEDVNYGKSNATIEIGDDYVDTIVKHLQAAAYPRYSATDKMVDPPLVTVRIGDEVYIKGVVSGTVSTTYGLPILKYKGKDRYAKISIQFPVSEVDPYSAQQIVQIGSFRGLNTSLERNIYQQGNSLSANMTGTPLSSRGTASAGISYSGTSSINRR